MQHVQVYKCLDRIWDDQTVQESHPGFKKGERWGQHNTLLVDDSVLKASAQPFNHIEVPEFVSGSEEEENHGGGKPILVQVVEYLEAARRWNDVSGFVRVQRFEHEEQWLEKSAENASQEHEELESDDDDGGGGVKL